MLGLCLGIATAAHAHKASDAYLQLARGGDGLSLRWDIALRDLDAMLDLDANHDEKLTWGEVKSRLDDIRTYALGHLRIDQGRCALIQEHPPALEKRVDGTYLVLQLKSSCEPTDSVLIDYSLFKEVDPTHRGLLRVAMGDGVAPVLHSLDPGAGAVRLELPRSADGVSQSDGPSRHDSGSAPAAASTFLADGVHHILIGYDHILFLLCLLLPSVLRRDPLGWHPVARASQAIWPMVGTVTMFTLGHSITLALAGLRWVTITPQVIEPAIAVTIILAAVDNLTPVLGSRKRIFTFLFGLIHGFGFAAVLQELDLPMRSFLVALLQFNLGVEGGQLIVVSLSLTVLLFMRRWRAYPSIVLHGGSGVAIVVAALWFVERVFDLKFLPI